MKNKTKTILFASLITAMILPFSEMGNANAESTLDSKYAQTVLEEMSPYITQNEDRTISFDAKSAKKDGVSKDVTKTAFKIVELQNKMVNGEKVEATMLDNYFEDVTAGEMSAVQNNSSGAVATSSTCDWYAQGTPIRNTYNTYSTTLSGAQSFLEGMGYHNVEWYALHPNAWANPAIAERDFQQSTTTHGCENGVFRTEVYILSSNTEYGHSTPEPNPEYLDNNWEWPVWYWPVYTVWWHSAY